MHDEREHASRSSNDHVVDVVNTSYQLPRITSNWAIFDDRGEGIILIVSRRFIF